MAIEYSKVELVEYDYDTKQNKSLGEVSMYTLSKCVKPGHIHYILESVLNSFNNPVRLGQEVGKLFVTSHRSLQGMFVNFCLGLLVGYSQEYEKQWAGYTDPRNETAVKTANHVAKLVESGDLPTQFLI